jgi:hypothetical protein
MIKQNVIIINIYSLYEILEEIKENLPFNILKNENDEINKENHNLNDSLTITIPNKKKLIKKNLLVLNEIPIPLNKLIEQINIGLIKAKFNYQSNISIKSYELNLNSKFFSKDSINLKLTEKEIEIILYLNTNKNKKNVQDLQKNIWGYTTNLDTHTVETHIYRLRKKIEDKFNDKNFIMSHKEGYFIE